MIERLYHKSVLIAVTLAALSGALLFLSFPRPGLYLFAWIALAPLLIALRAASPSESLLLGLVTGVVFFGSLLYWIALFGYAPWLLLSFFQAAFIAIFALLAGVCCRRNVFAALTIPAIWTAIEWLRTLGAFGFSWGGLAYSQASFPELIQIASLTGPWGLTFLIVAVNVLISEAIAFGLRSSAGRLRLASALAVVVVTAGAGWIVIQTNNLPKPDKKVAMVQGGVPMTWRDPDVLSRTIDAYWPMTRKIGKGYDFIVWPESSVPGDIFSSPVLRLEISRLARMNQAFMLVGSLHQIPDDSSVGFKEKNGACLISPDGDVVGEYFKVRLVPFGEFVPGRKWLPFINRYRIREADVVRGDGHRILPTYIGGIGAMICFESTFPDISRRLAGDGAEILFVITNDSWFGDTAAAAQHHDFSIFRAVETRRYVARNATTGVTSLIDPYGRVLAQAPLNTASVVEGYAGMLRGGTVYVSFGDWFAILCLIFAAAALVRSSRNDDIAGKNPGAEGYSSNPSR